MKINVLLAPIGLIYMQIQVAVTLEYEFWQNK